jgi:hypothetical protein
LRAGDLPPDTRKVLLEYLTDLEKFGKLLKSFLLYLEPNSAGELHAHVTRILPELASSWHTDSFTQMLQLAEVPIVLWHAIMSYFEKFRTTFDLSYAVRTFMGPSTKVTTVDNVSDLSGLYKGITSVLAACNEYDVPCSDVRQIYAAFFANCGYARHKGTDLHGVGPTLLRTMEELYTAYSYARELPDLDDLVVALADHVAMNNVSRTDTNLIAAITNTAASVQPEPVDSPRQTQRRKDVGATPSVQPCLYFMFDQCRRRRCSFSHDMNAASSIDAKTRGELMDKAKVFIPKRGPLTSCTLNEGKAKAAGLCLNDFHAFTDAKSPSLDVNAAAAASPDVAAASDDTASVFSEMSSASAPPSSVSSMSSKLSDVCVSLDGMDMTYEDVAAVLTDPDLGDLTDSERRRLDAHKERSESLYCCYVKRLYAEKYSS